MEIGRAGEREREGGGRREIECVREREKVLVCEGELYPRGGSRGRKGGEREREIEKKRGMQEGEGDGGGGGRERAG